MGGKILNYEFNRKSENYFDWLANQIQHINYHQVEAIIIDNKETN